MYKAVDVVADKDVDNLIFPDSTDQSDTDQRDSRRSYSRPRIAR